MTQYFSKGEDTYDDTDATAAVDRVRDAHIALSTLWPASFTYEVLGDVDVLQDTNGEVVDQVAATPRTGAGTSAYPLGPLPVGVLLKSRTNTFIGGRRLVGRTFFVPINNQSDTTATPGAGLKAAVVSFGTALLDAGLGLLVPTVWSRPRQATAVGPHRPAGLARSFRAGSSDAVVSYSCSDKYVVLTSRRD
jgi:hypothetical protein